MSVVTVVGARPQFVKASMLSRALERQGVEEHVVHTGQHYDDNMSAVFFEELGLRRPDVNLGVGSGSHGTQTGRIMVALEDYLNERAAGSQGSPDWVVTFGDTNSTAAGRDRRRQAGTAAGSC